MTFTSPPAVLTLGPDDVHVWRAVLDVPRGALDPLTATLDADERTRAAAFRLPLHGQRFAAARAFTRDVLSRYLGLAPAALHFGEGVHGKPRVAGGRVRFNLSDSDALALLAVAREREVGVDVERVRADTGGMAVAERFFAPAEVDTLRALPPAERAAAFVALWTHKEAYLKARGEGLSGGGLDRFAVSLHGGHPRLLDPGLAAAWSLATLAPGPGYAGAVAVQGTGWRLACFDWSPPSVVS